MSKKDYKKEILRLVKNSDEITALKYYVEYLGKLAPVPMSHPKKVRKFLEEYESSESHDVRVFLYRKFLRNGNYALTNISAYACDKMELPWVYTKEQLNDWKQGQYVDNSFLKFTTAMDVLRRAMRELPGIEAIYVRSYDLSVLNHVYVVSSTLANDAWQEWLENDLKDYDTAPHFRSRVINETAPYSKQLEDLGYVDITSMLTTSAAAEKDAVYNVLKKIHNMPGLGGVIKVYAIHDFAPTCIHVVCGNESFTEQAIKNACEEAYKQVNLSEYLPVLAIKQGDISSQLKDVVDYTYLLEDL